MPSIGDHEFGSGLTDLKISIIADYLHHYSTALSKQEFFQRWYFDVFAGTGERTVRLSASAGDLVSAPVEERILSVPALGIVLRRLATSRTSRCAVGCANP